MQQLEIKHKKSTSKIQKAETVEEKVNRQEERAATLVNSSCRRMYRLEGSNVFYIESSKYSIFHYCQMNFALGFRFCSCEDFKFRGNIRDCIHLSMIPIGIMKGKIVDVPTLPKDVIRDNMVAKDYREQREEEYSF